MFIASRKERNIKKQMSEVKKKQTVRKQGSVERKEHWPEHNIDLHTMQIAWRKTKKTFRYTTTTILRDENQLTN